MHEWALAEAVVATVTDAAEREGLTGISKIVISLGELQRVDREVFGFALKELMAARKALLGKAAVSYKTEAARLQCRACGHEWQWTDAGVDAGAAEAIHFVPEMAHTFLRCPKCGSPDFEITAGRGVWVDSVIGEKS